MPLDGFRVIKGRFHIRGYKPDGDSVRFTADNPGLFDGLYRDFKSVSPGGDFQLRLEGIDAPETHYAMECQPHGDVSRDRLLAMLGFSQVARDEEKIVNSTPDTIAGVIFTKGFDPHGRPISYALPGIPKELEAIANATFPIPSNDIQIPIALLAQTVNARMVQEGFAYPLLYTATPEPHRAWLREQAQAARSKNLGVWARDSSREFELVDRRSLCDATGTLIFPKFFRRSMDYLHQQASGFQGDFISWLSATLTENDQVMVSQQASTLSQLFQQRDRKVSCKADLLDLVFVEK